MIGRLIQHLTWKLFGAYRVDPAMLDGLDQAITEQAERMGLN